MAKAATRHRDDDDDDRPAPKAAAQTKGKAINPNLNTPEVPPAGVVLGPLPEGQASGDLLVVEPQLASDVAPGFTPGPVPGTATLSAIEGDTAPTYGTETPPRQSPPTNFDSAIKHSPPSFHDANGAPIASVAPTLTSIAPTTAAAGSADLTVTLTGTNFNRATFATFFGTLIPETTFVSATSLTFVLKPSLFVAGTYQVTAKNPAGESVQKPFVLT